ncbi:hypothetical protein PIB30_076759 [Stylosanthes scabra]|uniref:Uncharacterized protein n=1 Tax=Stylosanthes scabra TaxID=79078 RepID=A0ABU6YRR0_9FABA|nr:hypothetical protein [Stylosanthes scabra]
MKGWKDAKKNARCLKDVMMSAIKCLQMRRDAEIAILVASLSKQGFIVKFKTPGLEEIKKQSNIKKATNKKKGGIVRLEINKKGDLLMLKSKCYSNK